MKIDRQDGKIAVQRADDSQVNRALHGLTRTLIANMVAGVTPGFAKDLEISGTGYRAVLQGKKLPLALRFSHPIETVPQAGGPVPLGRPRKPPGSGTRHQPAAEAAATRGRQREPPH